VLLKDDNDWVKCCITWEVEGIRQRGHTKDLVGLCWEWHGKFRPVPKGCTVQE